LGATKLFAIFYGGKLVSVLDQPIVDEAYTIVAYEVRGPEELNYVLKPVLDALGINRPMSPAKVIWSKTGKPKTIQDCQISDWSTPIKIEFPSFDPSEAARKYLNLPPSVNEFSVPLIEVSAVYEDGSTKDYLVPAHVHGKGRLSGERIARILDLKDKKVKSLSARIGNCSIEYARPDPIISLSFDGSCFSYSYVRRSPYPANVTGSIEVISLVNGKLIKTERCVPSNFELAVARFKPSFVADSEYLATLAISNPPMIKSWNYENGKLTLELTCSCNVKAYISNLEYEDVVQLESGAFLVKPVLKEVEEVDAQAINGTLTIDVTPPVRVFLTTEEGIPIVPQKNLPSIASSLRPKIGNLAREIFGDDSDSSILALALYAPLLEKLLGMEVPPDLMEEVLKYTPLVIDLGPPKVLISGSPSLIEFDTNGNWAVLEIFVADDLNKKYASTTLKVKGRGFIRVKDFLVASVSDDKTAWDVLNPFGNFALGENETDRHPEYVEEFTGIPDLQPTRTLVRCGNCTIETNAEEWRDWLPQQLAEEYILNGTDLGFERVIKGEEGIQGLLSVVFLSIVPGLRQFTNISKGDYTRGKKELSCKYLVFFTNGQNSWIAEGSGLVNIPALYNDYLIVATTKGTMAFITPDSIHYSIIAISPDGLRIPIEVVKEEAGYIPSLPSIRLLSYDGETIEVELVADYSLIMRKPRVRWVLRALFPYQSYEESIDVGPLSGNRLTMKLPRWFKYGEVCIELDDELLSFKTC